MIVRKGRNHVLRHFLERTPLAAQAIAREAVDALRIGGPVRPIRRRLQKGCEVASLLGDSGHFDRVIGFGQDEASKSRNTIICEHLAPERPQGSPADRGTARRGHQVLQGWNATL